MKRKQPERKVGVQEISDEDISCLANLSGLIHGVTYEFLVTPFALGKVPGPRIESIDALSIYCFVHLIIPGRERFSARALPQAGLCGGS